MEEDGWLGLFVYPCFLCACEAAWLRGGDETMGIGISCDPMSASRSNPNYRHGLLAGVGPINNPYVKSPTAGEFKDVLTVENAIAINYQRH